MLRRVINKLYFLATGVRVGEVEKANANFTGVMQALTRLAPEMEVVPIADRFGDGEDPDTKELAELLARHGSDKSTKHDYHIAYAALLKGRRHEPLSILEIGLGTNDPAMPSSMRGRGKPGASVRAFRDWGERFTLYGADIDERILFSEDRITTYVVDQTKSESLAALAGRFGGTLFDLVIDDGLHTPWANLNTLQFALPLLKKGGHFVVEDIQDRFLPSWKVAMPLIPKGYSAEVVRARRESLLIVRREA